ncbi:MAG: succinate dehydrogenase [Bacteroidetes bacterium]|nr:MAG: succinate dehydrogenase [Bacteroidota bacterium]
MSNSLLNYASITKKISMSILGLFLAAFLLVHLTINLMLILPDEGEWFRASAEFMGTNPLIKVFEIVLFAAFIVHILMGIILWFENNSARPVGYQKTNVSKTSLMSKYMIHTGIIVFIFLGLHFIHFYFVKVGLISGLMDAEGHPDFYNSAIELFKQPLYAIIYIISFLALGFHLNHAIQSGFQSLGWEHSKYTAAIKIVSTLYSLLVAIGFSIIPIYFLIAG